LSTEGLPTFIFLQLKNCRNDSEISSHLCTGLVERHYQAEHSLT
jgi:hypothetical protein